MLVLAVAQPLLSSFDVAGNALAHAAAVRSAEARVVMFPEMSLTGYEFTAPVLDPDDPRLAPLVAACRETGSIALAGAPVAAESPEGGASGVSGASGASVNSGATGVGGDGDPSGASGPSRDGGVAGVGGGGGAGGVAVAGVGAESGVVGGGDRRCIGMLAVDGDGARVVYRKRYLGGGEPAVFTPGPGPVVLDVDGWRLGLAICKDTGVPEHAAALAALGIDVYVAGVLETAEDAAVPGERAARITAAHGVPVAMASYAGSTGDVFERAVGGSGVWAADGTPLARTGAAPGEVRTVALHR